MDYITPFPEISFVVPVYNEQDSLKELYKSIVSTGKAHCSSFEIIFVDDGSSDNSSSILLELEKNCALTKVLILSTNHGKAAAYAAGFDHAHGTLVVTLDSDLQDDPAELPKLLNALSHDFDLVVGYKEGRLKNEPTKKIPSTIFNSLKRIIFSQTFKDSNSGYRVMRSKVAKNIRLYGDRHRFIPELALSNGFRVTEVGVIHRPRKYGKTKYNWTRFITGIIDLCTIKFLTGFLYRPAHIFACTGCIPFFIGICLEVYVLLCKLLGSTFRTHSTALIAGAVLILIGIHFFMVGLIGELVISQSKDPVYKMKNKDLKEENKP